MTARISLPLVLALVVVGCGGRSPSAPATDVPAPPPAATAVATLAGSDAPPDAALAAEGGDPVIGQLGTYIWLGSGSDAPWLPGNPMTVGAGEPMAVTFQPPGDIAAWVARYVPADADGPDGAEPLASGQEAPAFDAPTAGSWTVEVQVTFLADAGTASYFWRLDVE